MIKFSVYMIKQELEQVKNSILEDFIDPFPDFSLKSFLSGSSKMIRSKIAVFYLKSYGCQITSDIIKILSACEIIHNASLLHDDVLDDADNRRGITTLAKKFNSKISILAGDYLLSFAIEKLLEVNNMQILNIFKDCTQKMSEAEIKQYFLRNRIPALDDYVGICESKTALLFSSVLESCSILANISQEQARKFGILFGIYFQFKNDLNNESAKIDKLNKINTIQDILGVEKTNNLLDNYKKEIQLLLKEIPDNEYKKSLEDLIKKL